MHRSTHPPVSVIGDATSLTRATQPMLETLNRIRNSDFSAGRRKPNAWEWRARGKQITWQSAANNGNGDATGVHLHSQSAASRGEWAQAFTTKKDQHYRIEAVVSCDCPGPEGGLVLALSALDESGRALCELETAPLRKAERFTLRTLLKTPTGVRRAELTIGLRGAGSAHVHDVRVVPILEPDARSHPWAVPPPPFANPAPIKVRRICILTERPDRPIVDILRTRFGDNAVTVHSSAKWHRALDAADAVLLLDGRLPAKLRSMRGTLAFAKNKIVIASLPVSERIGNEHLVTRTISQIDDPFHARIAYGDFPTAGFALHDIFPFAGRADDSTRQTQRQYRTNRVFREFCKTHGLHVLLDSETDAEATSEKPIALFRRTAGGALIFMDIEPAEAVTSSFAEPVLALRLILNALGAPQPLVGQYCSPARTDTELLHHLRDIVERYPELCFADPRTADDPHAPKLLFLGREVETLGLPIVPRPLVLLRSGLAGIDTAGIYGVLLWLKQLLRPAPFASTYASDLDRAFRIAWMPQAAPLHPWGGWSPGGSVEKFPIEIDFEPGSIAACIDVTTGNDQQLRVLTCGKTPLATRLHDALAPLANQLLGGRHFYHAVPRGRSAAEAGRTHWHADDITLEVRRDDTAFSEAWHRRARSAGADLIRIELPATTSDPTAHSIWQTDWAATILELVTGMMLGAVVVNRDSKPVTLDLPRTVRDLLSNTTLRRFNEPDTDLPVPVTRNGRITVPSAHAIVAVR